MPKKASLLIIFFLFALTGQRLSAENIPPAEKILQFRLQGDLSIAPWFYEPQYEMYCTDISASCMLGLKAYRFTIGSETFVDYLSMDGQNDSNLFLGASFNIRSTINSYFEINDWFEIKLGVGGIWQNSAFEFNESGVLAQSLWGLSLLFNVQFGLPGPYLDLEFKNMLDLFFVKDLEQNFSGLGPTYAGGLRANFHPGIPWLSLFLEVNAIIWKYQSEINSVTTAMAEVNAGIALRIIAPERDYRRKPNAEPLQPENTGTKETQEVIIMSPPKEINLNEANLTRIANAKVGEQFTFTNITFLNLVSILNIEAKEALNKLAFILTQSKNLHFSISGYSELMGDPKNELDLSVSRANEVRNYLILQGVERERLKITQVGQLSSTKVIFLVIKN
jgi:outer membrane protein OmpA-like peptidoglycan-associated protein